MQIFHGDCLAILPTIEAETIDAVVTDPPYGLEFMGREWDGSDGFRRSLNEADTGRANAFGRLSKHGPEYRAGHLFQEWCEAWAKECLRVLKPGGHILAFGGTRTYHRLACAIEDAGFEVRDQIQWIYATGFPKSRATLKPAHEPIVMARKPLIGTVAANTELHGTGALNIDACRVAAGVHAGKDRKGEASAERRYTAKGATNFAATPGPRGGDPQGRYPANIIHDGSEEVLAGFPESAGQLAYVGPEQGDRPLRGDSGSAARFFFLRRES